METETTITLRGAVTGLRPSDVANLLSLVGYSSTEAELIGKASLEELEAGFPVRAEQLARAEAEYEQAAKSRPSYAPGATRTEQGALIVARNARQALRLLAGAIALRRTGKALPAANRYASSNTSQALLSWYRSPIGTERPAQ